MKMKLAMGQEYRFGCLGFYIKNLFSVSACALREDAGLFAEMYSSAPLNLSF